MADRPSETNAHLIAELNDMLQLDHDAVQAYTIAIENLEDDAYRETLVRFRGDHERHIEELTRLIRDHGGIPLELAHIPSGFFKLAVQKIGTAGGDRAILLAFKANERQVCDRYRAAAEMGHPPAVDEVLKRNAADEERHYAWAAETLEALGVGPESMLGRAEEVFERAHAATATAFENAERRVMESTEGMRRGAHDLGPRVRAGAGSGLASAASAIDRAGNWVEGRDGSIAVRAGSVAHSFADTLENAAAYLRSHEFRALRGDLEREIDRHPLRAALIALGAGFLAGQVLR